MRQEKDYDAEIQLLAALQPDGVSMHNIEHVLKRRPIFQNPKAYQIPTKITSKGTARINNILSDRF